MRHPTYQHGHTQYIAHTDVIDRLEPWGINITDMLQIADACTQTKYPTFSWTKMALERDTVTSFLEGLLAGLEAHVRVDPSPTPYVMVQQGHSGLIEPLMSQQGTMNGEVYNQLESEIYGCLTDQATIYCCDAAIIDREIYKSGNHPDIIMTPQLKEELYYIPFSQDWVSSLTSQLSQCFTQLIGQVVLPIYFHHSTPLDRQKGIYISLYTAAVRVIGNQAYIIIMPRVHVNG